MLTVVINASGSALRAEPLLYPLRRECQRRMAVFDVWPIGDGEIAGIAEIVRDWAGRGSWRLCLVLRADDNARLRQPIERLLEIGQEIGKRLGGTGEEDCHGYVLVLIDPHAGVRTHARQLDVLGYIDDHRRSLPHVTLADLEDLDRASSCYSPDRPMVAQDDARMPRSGEGRSMEAELSQVTEAAGRLLKAKVPEWPGLEEAFRAAYASRLGGRVEQGGPSGVLASILQRAIGIGEHLERVHLVRLRREVEAGTDGIPSLQYVLLALALLPFPRPQSGGYWEATVAGQPEELQRVWASYRVALESAQEQLERDKKRLAAPVDESFFDSAGCEHAPPLPELKSVPPLPRFGLIRTEAERSTRFDPWVERCEQVLNANDAAISTWLAERRSSPVAGKEWPDVRCEGTPDQLVSRFQVDLKEAQQQVLQEVRLEHQSEGLQPRSAKEETWARRKRRYLAVFDECARRRPTIVQLGAALGVGLVLVLTGYAAGTVQPPGWANLFDRWASWAPMVGAVGLLWLALVVGGLVWVDRPLRALVRRIERERADVIRNQKEAVKRASAALKPRCLAAVARRNLTRAIELRQRQVQLRLAISYHEQRLKEHVLGLGGRQGQVAPAAEAWGQPVPLDYSKPDFENAIYAPQTCRGAMPRAATSVVMGELREEVDVYLRGIDRVSITRCDIARLGS